MSASDRQWTGQCLHAVRHALATLLREQGIATADIDARLLLQHATGLSHAALIAEERSRRLDEAEAARLDEWTRRRLAGEPVSRIIGRRGFFGRDFIISPDVLDPRPETELLVEAALKLRPCIEALHAGPPLLCDAGAGSGCIIVSLLAEWPQARGLALDISAEALAITQHNAAMHGVDKRLLCLCSDWLQAVGGPLDILLSNPPYLTTRDMQRLPAEVRHDPARALAAGQDGLAAYRQLAQRARLVLRPGGWLLLEVGQGQARAVRALFEHAGFRAHPALPPIMADLAGIDRIIALQRLHQDS